MNIRRTLTITAAFISPILCCCVFLVLLIAGIVPALRTELEQFWVPEDSPDPVHPIISFDASMGSIYASTSDKRVFAKFAEYPGALIGWTELRRPIQFDHSPLLGAVDDFGGLFAADGQRLFYRIEGFAGDNWVEIENPLHGEIRTILAAKTSDYAADIFVFLVGDSRIVYARFKGVCVGACPQPWQETWREIWNGQPVRSNLAIGDNRIMLVSNGRVMARSFTWREWADVTGNLTEKAIRFVAFGAGVWAVAASDTQVYRSPVSSLADWKPFTTGLPAGYTVQGIAGNRIVAAQYTAPLQGKIALFTDKGGFVFSGGGQWNDLGFGKPKFYAHLFESTLDAGGRDVTVIVTDRGVWRWDSRSNTVGAFFLYIGLAWCLPFGFIVSIILGVMAAVSTSRRLRPRSEAA